MKTLSEMVPNTEITINTPPALLKKRTTAWLRVNNFNGFSAPVPAFNPTQNGD